MRRDQRRKARKDAKKRLGKFQQKLTTNLVSTIQVGIFLAACWNVVDVIDSTHWFHCIKVGIALWPRLFHEFSELGYNMVRHCFKLLGRVGLSVLKVGHSYVLIDSQ